MIYIYIYEISNCVLITLSCLCILEAGRSTTALYEGSKEPYIKHIPCSGTPGLSVDIQQVHKNNYCVIFFYELYTRVGSLSRMSAERALPDKTQLFYILWHYYYHYYYYRYICTYKGQCYMSISMKYLYMHTNAWCLSVSFTTRYKMF